MNIPKESNILRLRGVSKSFQSGKETLNILKGIDLTMPRGKIMVITGESGAGKSTLLHVIGGLDTADNGEIYMRNVALHTLNEYQRTIYRKNIGYIFQFHYLLSDFTAEENIALPAQIMGAKRKRALQLARNLIKAVRLEPRRGHYPYQLSGGERQRVAVARSLVNNPELILADEPTGNLDEHNSRLVENLLFYLVRERSKSLVVVTHDITIAAKADIHLHLSNSRLRPS